MDSRTASQYIRANFEPADWIAIVALNRSKADPRQRVVIAEHAARPQFQRELSDLNEKGHEIYVSMNTIREGRHSRKKADIARIRHVFLDFDNGGPEAARETIARAGVPVPNHLIETSPGKSQAIWRVEGFEAAGSENLMRGMVRQFGADPASVDRSRVLRLPGYLNHKYYPPFLVKVADLSSEVYTPSQFPHFEVSEAERHTPTPRRRNPDAGVSQSELDWAYANRALARGEDPEAIIQAMAAFRSDKPDPQYYARHTVTNVAAAIERKQQPSPTQGFSHGF